MVARILAIRFPLQSIMSASMIMVVWPLCAMWLTTRIVSPGTAVRMKFIVRATVTTEEPTGDTGYGIGQCSQYAAVNPSRMIGMDGRVCFQADCGTPAMDFINVDVKIFFHERIVLINFADTVPDFLRVRQLFDLIFHNHVPSYNKKRMNTATLLA